MTWPRIGDPVLVERLALDDAGFRDAYRAIAVELGRREYDPRLYARAVAYPWERPAHSYVLRDGEVEPLEGAPPPELTEGRHAVLAIGSNGAPRVLAAKVAHLADRDVAVVAGELHDLDVGASATVTIYGSVPATVFASPGTAVRAAVLYLTDAQVTQLTGSELSYRLGRLDGARFAGDGGVEVRDVLAYVSRFGAFAPGGETRALAAIPARGRRAPARTQEELLAEMAALTGHPGPEDLVRGIWEDVAGVFGRLAATVWPLGEPLSRWTPYRLPQ